MSPHHRSDPLVETRAAKLDRIFAAPFLLQWLGVIAYVWTRSAAVQAANEQAIFSDLEGEEGMHELLEGFVQRLRGTSIELETTSDRGDLAHIARRLRGTAASYGFAPISAAAGTLEEAIQSQSSVAGGVSAEVAHLVSLCRKARSRRLVARAA